MMCGCYADICQVLAVQLKFDRCRWRQVGSLFRVVEVELVVEDDHVYVVVQSVRRRTVHHAVLAHEAGSAVVVDNELERLVEPSVAAVAMPVLMRSLMKSHWRGVVKTDHERRCFDCFESCLVGRRSSD